VIRTRRGLQVIANIRRLVSNWKTKTSKRSLAKWLGQDSKTTPTTQRAAAGRLTPQASGEWYRPYNVYFHFFGGVSSKDWQKSRKISKKTRYMGSRSFKVNEFVTNRKGICDFLYLWLKSNLGRILQIFRATAT